MSDEAGPLVSGKKTIEAREIIVNYLKTQNLIEKEEEIVHSVPYCERCNTKVEPIADMQWFMKMDELSGTAARAVKKGEVKFVPKRWEKLYFDWLRQKRDWAISRQLWWGHRLPVWFHEPKCTPIPGREKNIENSRLVRLFAFYHHLRFLENQRFNLWSKNKKRKHKRPACAGRRKIHG